MTDTRRVCDLTAAEMIEAGLAATAWKDGKWEVTFAIEDGRVRTGRYPVLVSEGRIVWASVGRDGLDVRQSRAA